MGKPSFIYAIGIEGMLSVKIGKTTGPVIKRLAELQTGQPAPLKVLASVPIDHNLSRIEKAIHRFLEADRQRGEWFAVQVDQAQLDDLIVRAVQWVATEDASVQHLLRGPTLAQPGSIGERIKRLRTQRGLTQT